MKQSEIKNCNGFTFLENLIVVGVILILSLGLIGLINPVRRFAEARDNKRETHLNTIWSAVEQKIYQDKGWENCPPLPTDTFREIGTGPEMFDLYGCLQPKYLSNRIVDPKEGFDAGGRNITDGLVGHWTFDEGEGDTAYDYSGNDNHGTLVNNPQWVDGKINGALDLDTTAGDYVVVSHNEIFDFGSDGRFLSDSLDGNHF
jgi:type II secretory pathway pseudopilin PulG